MKDEEEKYPWNRNRNKLRTIKGRGICDIQGFSAVKGPRGNQTKDFAFRKWEGMLDRVGNPAFPPYMDCSINPDWLYLSKFKAWIEAQPAYLNGLNLSLDKDILVIGNREYGPSRCCLVPMWVNTAILLSGGQRGEWPLGVCLMKPSGNGSFRKKPFKAAIRTDGKPTCLGYYKTPLEAHAAWQEAKVNEFQKLILKYMLDLSYQQKVANALYNRVEILEDDLANNRETKYL